MAAKKKKEEDVSSTSTAAASSAAAGSGPVDDGEETADKVGKKVRAVEKKLRQINELKEMKAGGKPLESNQLAKIDAEEQVRTELFGLNLKLKQIEEEEGRYKWR